MKKTLSRTLSLALVLAMLISVVPFALAADASVELTAPETVEAGTPLTMSASLKDGPEGAAVAYAWTGDVTGNAATVTKDIPADTEPDTVLTGKVTISYTYYADGTTPVTEEVEATYSVKVVAPVEHTYEVTVAKTLEVALGDTKELTVTVTDKTAEKDITPVKVEWSSKDTAIATVENGKVTGKANGETEITAVVTPAEGVAPVEVKCTVKVYEGAKIVCDNVSTSSSYVDLKPTMVMADGKTEYTDVKYTYSVNGGTATESNRVLKGTDYGVRKVLITGTATNNGVTVTATKEVKVSFYGSADLTVYMKDGTSSFDFAQDSAFSSTYFDGASKGSNYSVKDLMDIAASYYGIGRYSRYFRFVPDTASKVGKLEYKQLSSTGLNLVLYENVDLVVFTALSSTGSYTATYQVLDSDELVMAEGVLTIYVADASDIVYETNYNQSVTFDEDDFEAYWKSYGSTTISLDYVEFGTPKYGTLYTDSTKTTKVTSSMMFKPNYTSSVLYRDLDTVTYVPDSGLTAAYTDTISFTAYGTNGTKISGTVSIVLNSGNNSITSRGVVFGNGTNSIADQMATAYKTVIKSDLAYVTFVLPDVEDGRLYYSYSGIMESTRVDKASKYYVSPTSSQLSLDKVAFIPAAGTVGKVTISYIGYDKNGANPYEGKIVLNVTAKTKSDKFTDVTATNYSWAADSIDFLYYEEVVNGISDSKYGPSSSITRGDFMLMLYRAFLAEDYGKYTVTSNFADVTKGTTTYSQETYQAVGVAKYLGIAKGDGTNFKPKSSITREEAMTLLYRTLEVLDLDLEYTSNKTTSSFTDYNKVSSYAQESITYLIKHGIVIGSNGLISPKSNITRAEMAVILHRVLTY